MPQARISIVHCIWSLRIGGAERQLAELISRLPADRFEQQLILYRAEGELIEQVEAAGCEIIGLLPPERVPPPRFRTTAGRVLAVIRFAGHLRRRQPDVLHGQLDLANVASMLAGRAVNVPVVVTSELNLCRDPAGRTLKQRALNRANRRASAVFANSRAVVDGLVRYSGIDPDRIRLIYNGVDLDRYQSADVDRQRATRTEHDIGPDERVIACVANLHLYKGHVDLVRAFASLDPGRRGLRLLLVGRDMGAGPPSMAVAAELGVTEWVRFTGLDESVEDVLSIAEVVVHPSHEEGFSNAILEAMSVGRPVVACDVGGNGEAIVDGETGLLVPPHDPEALAAAINSLLVDPDRSAAFGRAGRKRVEREFSVDRMVGEFADLYQQLADDAAAPRDAGETRAADAPGTYTRLDSGSTPGGSPR